MKECIYGDIRVGYCGLEESVEELPDGFDYLLAKARPEDAARIAGLEEKGFMFHNRTILGEINLESLKEEPVRKIRADVRTDREFTQDVYGLAQGAFRTDRRFHLARQFDNDAAGKILKGYIDFYKEQESVLFKCFHKERLVGFTIVQMLEGGCCENVLGAVEPAYQSRGAALNLYSYMLQQLRESGRKRLYGRISTANTASINLHIALGAKYSLPEDDYIYRYGKCL